MSRNTPPRISPCESPFTLTPVRRNAFCDHTAKAKVEDWGLTGLTLNLLTRQSEMPGVANHQKFLTFIVRDKPAVYPRQ